MGGSTFWWNAVFLGVSFISMILGAGIFWRLTEIARWVGQTEQLLGRLTTDVSSYGAMTQQLTKDVARIDGFMEGKDN